MPAVSDRKKIAIVVQRYGPAINGGAEVHARSIAQRLAGFYDVTVLTSCAIDHHTWNPVLPAGESMEEGIRIIRFDHPPGGLNGIKALQYELLKISVKLYSLLSKNKIRRGRRKASRAEQAFEKLKLIKQGPFIPKLVDYIKEHETQYDVFIFFTYLYYPTAIGLPYVGAKSILIPTLHDEPAVYRSIYQKLMSSPAAIFFNTAAEKKLAENIFDISKSIKKIVAVGIEVPDLKPDAGILEKYGIKKPYLIYVGRIDKGKGCNRLIRMHKEYVHDKGDQIRLVMVGKSKLRRHEKGEAIFTGFVSEEEKHQLIGQAAALVMPSPYESLSLALLEGFAHGIPGLVNGHCKVLADHIAAGKSGWTYTGREEFEKALDHITGKLRETHSLGENGKRYVMENYRWEIILKTYSDVISAIAEPTNG
jgi:glycosyltransferase involved in cell wall biosynthesis